MNEKLREKITEAFTSVLPISVIVLIICTLVVPIPLGTVTMFLVGAALLIIGMGFFTMGAEMAMMPIGEGLGAEVTKSKKLWLALGAAMVLGVIITIAEPDLQVLASQVPSIPNMLLILSVATGVGIFMAVAVMRILFGVSLSKLFIIFYSGLLILSIFTPDIFLPVAFDSGGVTTGPVTVPFMLALGAGIAGVRADKNSQDDSFGLVGLCSVGPIIAVMLLGILFKPQDAGYTRVIIPSVETMGDVLSQFAIHLPETFKSMFVAIFPICLFFAVFQLVTRRFRKLQLAKIVVGIIYTLLGLVLFLTGVDVGFIPVGALLGQSLAETSHQWVLVPLGMLIGYFIVSAEPAVHVLNKQVSELSEGAITERAMGLCLSIGVSCSVGLAVIRVLTGISIYWVIVPGYITALLLTLRVPKLFIGIAFDSGGVASGPMATTFLLPFVMGACEAVGGNVLTDAFGAIALVAMTPILAILVLGYIYKDRMKASSAVADEVEMVGLLELYEQEGSYESEAFWRR